MGTSINDLFISCPKTIRGKQTVQCWSMEGDAILELSNCGQLFRSVTLIVPLIEARCNVFMVKCGLDYSQGEAT